MRLIDADALMEIITLHCYLVRQENNSIEPGMTSVGILQAIQEQPTIEPERKKGKWISRDGREDCYECSECHAVIEGDEVYWRNNYFCYHCGADMRKEEMSE